MTRGFISALCCAPEGPSDFLRAMAQTMGRLITLRERDLAVVFEQWSGDPDDVLDPIVEYTDIAEYVPAERLVAICMDHECPAALDRILSNQDLVTYEAYDEALQYARERKASQSILACLLKHQHRYRDASGDPFDIGLDAFAAPRVQKHWILNRRADGSLRVISYKGGLGRIVCVPDRMEHIPITGIDTSAFKDSKDEIEELTLPGSIRTVPDGLLRGAKLLKKVYLREGIEKVGQDAFSNCSTLEDVSLPSTLKAIGRAAFSSCMGLRSIAGLHDDVRVVGGAFTGCPELIKRQEPLILANTLIAADLARVDSVLEVPAGVHFDAGSLPHLPLLMERRGAGFAELAESGEHIVFGRFPYDGSLRKAPLRWIPVEYTEESVLMVTRDIIAVMPGELMWADREGYNIREWLNGTFAEKAFTEEERKRLIPVDHFFNGGIYEEDVVFLLSRSEAERMPRRHADAVLTPYARAQMDSSHRGDRTAWLVYGQQCFGESIVYGFDGHRMRTCDHSTYGTFRAKDIRAAGVRPAVWVRSSYIPENKTTFCCAYTPAASLQ